MEEHVHDSCELDRSGRHSWNTAIGYIASRTVASANGPRRDTIVSELHVEERVVVFADHHLVKVHPNICTAIRIVYLTRRSLGVSMNQVLEANRPSDHFVLPLR